MKQTHVIPSDSEGSPLHMEVPRRSATTLSRAQRGISDTPKHPSSQAPRDLGMTAAIFIFLGMLCSWIPAAFSWNSLGHRMVMQYALDALSPEVKRELNYYNHALDKVYYPTSIINAASWLDEIRYQHVNWFDALHYYDEPYTTDGSKVPSTPEPNAVTAIQMATASLKQQRMRTFDKGMALRILIHVTADLHQPMHAINRFSKEFPSGDKGGNLVLLPTNPTAHNLHEYWDVGGGFLANKPKIKHEIFKSKINQLETQYACDITQMELNPLIWQNESYELAKKVAYNSKVSPEHQDLVAKISEQRLALAGCRLAALLTTIFANESPSRAR